MKRLREETYNFPLLRRHDKQIMSLSKVMSQNTTNDDDMITAITHASNKERPCKPSNSLTDETLNFYCCYIKHLARLQSSNKEFAQLESVSYLKLPSS